ncbi:hypothetical protein HKCCA1058_01325 [Rhodobacterales bacterium HKCCA1058]|nr:hypothetical protein [Rhodobacterales bacterium HKCCA1058]
MKHLVAIALTATLLAATSATAQEVDPRIEAMVSELHAEGYTEFTLNDSIFTPPTLVAEQAAILLRLRLDPDTLAPTAATMALDTDGDGILSARERRKRIELVDASGQAILALSAINEVTNRIEQHMQASLVFVQSLGGAGGWVNRTFAVSACGIDVNCHYDPMCGCVAQYSDLSPVGKALADGKIGGGQNSDAVRDAARDAVAPVINDRANDARDAARDTARDAISDRASDRR